MTPTQREEIEREATKYVNELLQQGITIDKRHWQAYFDGRMKTAEMYKRVIKSLEDQISEFKSILEKSDLICDCELMTIEGTAVICNFCSGKRHVRPKEPS